MRELEENRELHDAFLEAERGTVSAQGFSTLAKLSRRVLAWFDAEEIDPREAGIADAVRFQAYLAEYRSERGTPYATGTVINHLKAARRLFSYLVRTEQRTTNPFAELRYPRAGEHLSRNVLTEAQMGRLLRELGKFDEPATRRARVRRYRTHVVAEVLYGTGLRVAEAGALRESDVDTARRLVRVRSGKGGKSRTAFLSSYAAQVLDQYLQAGREAVLGTYARTHGDTLFGADKARLAAVVNGELRAVCRALELPEITTHGFRHSLGTHLLRSGCDMRHIQAILGHEALGTTQIYTKVDKEDLKRSLDAYHPRRWNGREDDGRDDAFPGFAPGR